MKQKSYLTLSDVTKEYVQGGVTISVLCNCSIRFEQGTSYAITGISGSGKSTLIHLLAGLDTPSSGAVYYNETRINRLLPEEQSNFLNKNVGLVFQVPHLIKELSVVENCMLTGLIAGRTIEECRDRAYQLLSYVGLPDKAQHKPSSLSGGQQQRIAIARALFNKPIFLLADEPTGNVDKDTGLRIVDLLIACQQEHGMGLIISTHDSYVAERMQYQCLLSSRQLLCE